MIVNFHAASAAQQLNFSDRGSSLKEYNPEELLKKLQDKKRMEKINDSKYISV
jgi:hypothetical protein